jgi:hypothetical protein
MKVITHDDECINGNNEVLSQVPHALLEPIFTMSIVFSGESIKLT